MRRVAALALCALLVSCVPPEESNDKVKSYSEETIMGQIQARGTLIVGIPTDYPPFAIVEERETGPLTSDPEGFVVDIAELIAESLGVEAEYIAAPSDELLELVEVDRNLEPTAETPADIVFPMVPITEELVQEYTFTDPYWVGHARELEIPAALGRGRGAPGSYALRMLPNEPAPDVELLRFAYANPDAKITGEQWSTEGYGAAVRTKASTFAALASQVINEADAEGDWARFYERWLAEYFAEPAPENVPIMTVEEAAALYPIELD